MSSCRRAFRTRPFVCVCVCPKSMLVHAAFLEPVHVGSPFWVSIPLSNTLDWLHVTDRPQTANGHAADSSAPTDRCLLRRLQDGGHHGRKEEPCLHFGGGPVAQWCPFSSFCLWEGLPLSSTNQKQDALFFPSATEHLRRGDQLAGWTQTQKLPSGFHPSCRLFGVRVSLKNQTTKQNGFFHHGDPQGQHVFC